MLGAQLLEQAPAQSRLQEPDCPVIGNQGGWPDLYWVLLTTGLRTDEVCGLKWEDVTIAEDGQSGHLEVKRKVYRLPLNVGGGVDYGEPKSEAGKRLIGLIPETIAQLAQWRQQQDLERELQREKWKEGGWVFTRRTGTHLEGADIVVNFHRLLSKYGFEQLRPHDMRHSFVTTLINASENLVEVQRVAGHASLATTTGIYWHFLKGTEQKSAKTLRGALFPES